MRACAFLILLLAILPLGCGASDDAEFITLASTTSPENSGLYAVLLPKFREASGIDVHAVPVGTGKAIRLGRDGNADVVFVHNRKLEDAFIADGHGVERRAVMRNEFVIVGPPDDPAEIGALKDGSEAVFRIAKTKSNFISRGDESGTHLRELAIWKRAGIDPTPASGTWYQESGSGMGATLNVAVAKGAYCLTDSSTWGAFANKGDLEVIFRGDPRLQNHYTIIVVQSSPKRKLAEKFVNWLTGPQGQSVIGSFRVNDAQLFAPSAAR